MSIQEYIDLKDYTTFRLSSKARYFIIARSIEDLRAGFGFAEEQKLPAFILGSGSNIILSQADVFEAVVLKIEIPGFEVIEETSDQTVITVGAGENWDDVVSRAVRMNLSGIEAMSLIPGTAGATPIQNVGAYGREIADVLISLEVYDIASGEVRTMSKTECQFSYRDSIFKHEAKGKYVITSVTLQLSKAQPTVPDYPGVQKYFEDHGITNPTLKQIREAIIAIRTIKLPDPKDVASVGSFFKNPFVSKEQYESLREKYPEIIAFPQAGDRYKIGAGWMLETLGLRGKAFGNLLFYPGNALVIVNKGQATFPELFSLVEETKTKIKAAFDIELQEEPIII